jgi:hypothetical protein
VLTSSSLGEESVEGIITTSDGLVRWHLTVRLDTVFQAKEFPAGVTYLDTSLTYVQTNGLSHCLSRKVASGQAKGIETQTSLRNEFPLHACVSVANDFSGEFFDKMPLMDDLIGQMPPVTRLIIATSGLLALLSTLDMVSPLSLYLNWDLVIKERQWWRLFTCFFFFGEFSVHFCWHIYVYLQYCSSLEQVGFRGRVADFVWMIASSGLLLLALTAALRVNSNFLSAALMDVMIYL